MKANLDCMRDVLCYIYNNIDDMEKIRFESITAACKDYTNDELTSTLKRIVKAGMVVVLPIPKLVITDITADGIECMRNLLE